MQQKKKRIGILIVFFLLLIFGNRNHADFYTVSFNKMHFRLPTEIESVSYVRVGNMEKTVLFDSKEELEKWKSFVMQLNNTTFQRGKWLVASNYCGETITIKFSGIEVPLQIIYGGESISMDSFMWIPTEGLKLPFSEEEFSMLAETEITE